MTDALIVFFGVAALVFAGLVLAMRQPMRAALALVAHMTCLAAIFACLSVHVVALFQILIYVGAVMVFMIYTIMLLDDRDAAYRGRFSRSTVAGVVVAALLAGMLLVPASGIALRSAPAVAGGSAATLGFSAFSIEFMRQYWFHFEVATVLLLVGIVSAWTALRETR